MFCSFSNFISSVLFLFFPDAEGNCLYGTRRPKWFPPWIRHTPSAHDAQLSTLHPGAPLHASLSVQDSLWWGPAHGCAGQRHHPQGPAFQRASLALDISQPKRHFGETGREAR